ncbi:MAG: phosphohistidine phosphatase [Rickettsiales bacterium]|nr:phosphohistidine phosphatase [Rickettsiales bacterium]
MLRLYFLRHGKAKTAADLADIDRPLSDQGRLDAVLMGRRLANWNEVPSLILCSAAQRARETLSGLIPSLKGNTLIEIEERLYTFEPTEVLERLAEISESNTAVLLVGHNPALEIATEYLAADSSPNAIQQINTNFPPCALAALEFNTNSWPAIGAKTGRLVRFSTPKEDWGYNQV